MCVFLSNWERAVSAFSIQTFCLVFKTRCRATKRFARSAHFIRCRDTRLFGTYNSTTQCITDAISWLPSLRCSDRTSAVGIPRFCETHFLLVLQDVWCAQPCLNSWTSSKNVGESGFPLFGANLARMLGQPNANSPHYSLKGNSCSQCRLHQQYIF